MKTQIENSKKDLQIIANRLSEKGINVTVSIVREGTPGEYPTVVLWNENYRKALSELHEVRSLINSNDDKFSDSYVMEVGYSTNEALFEIRPLFSYNITR